MNPKYIIIAVVIIILAGGAVLLNNKSKNQKNQEQNVSNQNQTSQSTNNTVVNQQTNKDTTKGCDPGTDFSKTDAKGRFLPTIDIANKIAVLETSMGKIEIQLYDKDAPKTVENFVCLIQRGYYDNIKFHRVAHGFVIQAGDPTGTGSGGESIYGAKFEDELYADTLSYKAGYLKGVVAMANAGPDTNGSQFFIVLQDVALPHNYTIFGKVSSGIDVAEKIGMVDVNPVLGPDDGSPITPVIINKATIK